MTTTIIEERLQRFLAPDVHLKKGAGQGANGTIDVCAVQAADWLAGGTGASDKPDCVSRKIGSYVIGLNDSLILRTRIHGATDWLTETKIAPQLLVAGSGNMSLSAKSISVDVGDAIDVGVAYQDFTGEVSTTVWPTGLSNIADANGSFLNSGTGTMLRARTDSSFTAAVDSSGRILNVPFAAGAVLNTDGSYSGFTSGGLTTNYSFSFPSGAGAIAEFGFIFKCASFTGTVEIILGTSTSGYMVSWNGGSNLVNIYSIVLGVPTSIANFGATMNGNIHGLRIAVVAGSPNTINVTLDETEVLVHDSSVTLTTGTWPITITDLGTGVKIWNFQTFGPGVEVYKGLHPTLQALIPTSSVGAGLTGIDNAADGITYARVKAAGITSGVVSAVVSGTVIGAGANLYSGTGVPTITGCPIGSKFYRTDGPDPNHTEYLYTTAGWLPAQYYGVAP